MAAKPLFLNFGSPAAKPTSKDKMQQNKWVCHGVCFLGDPPPPKRTVLQVPLKSNKSTKQIGVRLKRERPKSERPHCLLQGRIPLQRRVQRVKQLRQLRRRQPSVGVQPQLLKLLLRPNHFVQTTSAWWPE